jgi:hypothetical protein
MTRRKATLFRKICAGNGPTFPQTDFEISDPALVPSRLVLAAQQSGCHYAENMPSARVRFMRLGGRRLAFVFCREGADSLSHRVFDLSNLAKPTPVEFPVLAPPKGFGTTVSPGVITREQETGLFLAITGSDTDLRRIRHTYRFDDYRGFVIVRVEFQQDRISEWTALWDATSWSFPAASK